jgi:hypothetical protein
MSPEDRTGPLLVFTLCVAALMLVLWMDWVSSRGRGLFTPASPSPMAADTDAAASRPPGR